MTALTFAAALGAAEGCSAHAPDADGAACVSTREFFVQQVWSTFMGHKCIQCHMPDGVAVAENHARLVLQPPSFPGFVDANLAKVRDVATIEYDGTSELLLKPLGKLGHGGGVQIDANGPEAAALKELIARFAAPDSCADPAPAVLANVVLLDPASTLRKAALDLANRLPTAQEQAAVAAGGEAALDAALDAMMHEDAFFDRVREMFGDRLLTDKLAPNANALFSLSWDDFPAAKPYLDGNSPTYGDPKTGHMNVGLAREPLDLIAHVVRMEKPFTEILTANYTVVNPFTAIVYGLDGKIAFKNPTDDMEFVEAQVAEASGPLPQAGVLTTPSFLIRWPSTTSNVNRGRARRVLDLFLATDILSLGDRPINVSNFSRTDNPTRDAAACTTCHATLDPIAGTFRGFNNGTWYARWDPAAPWHDEMFAPGFDGTMLPSADYSKGPAWLAQQVVADPRFPIAAIQTVYTGLTGRKPLTLPKDTTAADYGASLVAWEAQDALFRQIAADFTNNGWNLKRVVKAIVKSPYYRGAGLVRPVSPDQEAAYADIGIGQLLTPAALDRKITAITGFHWRQPWHQTDKVTGKEEYYNWLTSNFYTEYGGIDFDSIVTRPTAPNGIMTNIASRMANEVTCATANWDFALPTASRHLFPLVELAEVPEANGAPVASAVAHIRANIQYLHQLFLGETLAADDPEIDRTYSLFLTTFRELSASGDTSVPCDVYPPTGETEATPNPVKTDDHHTFRAWMAVESYLLSDWKFLYQ